MSGDLTRLCLYMSPNHHVKFINPIQILLPLKLNLLLEVGFAKQIYHILAKNEKCNYAAAKENP